MDSKNNSLVKSQDENISQLQAINYKTVGYIINSKLQDESKILSENIGKINTTLLDPLSNNMVKKVQEKSYYNMYNKQMSNLNFFEKHLYLSKSKEEALKQERIKKSEFNASMVKLFANGADITLRFFLPIILSDLKKKSISKTIVQIYKYASLCERKNNLANDTLLLSILSDLYPYSINPLNNITKRSLLKLQIPKRPMDIDYNSDVIKFREQLGIDLHKIYINNEISNKTIINEKKEMFELIGFEQSSELNEFLEYSQNTHNKSIQHYSQTTNLVFSIFNYIANRMNINDETIKRTSSYLIQYDPIKESRERNQYLLKEGSKLAITAIAMATTGPIGDVAAISAYTLFQKIISKDNAYKKTQDILDERFIEFFKNCNNNSGDSLDLIKKESKKQIKQML